MVAAADTLIGARLDEYEIEALLGRGGMARVYRACDRRLGRLAALKLIDAPAGQPAETRARFEREARAIAQLDHPNIVRLYRYGEAGGQLYMAMEYVDGPTLQQALAGLPEPAALPAGEVIHLAESLGAALDAAHARGVIHRDVKPSNILLDRQRGRAVLSDFGLALLAPLGTRGDALGSPHYLAPEQAQSSGGTVPQSDLYALGVILYEALTGHVPFDGETPIAVALQHIEASPPPARQARPDLSPAVEAVLERALAKQPAERYPTGAALATALRQAFAGERLFAGAALPAGTRTAQRAAVPAARTSANGHGSAAPLATLLAAPANGQPAAPRLGPADTLPSRPAGWDKQLGARAGRRARPRSGPAPAEVFLVVLLAAGMLMALLWNLALKSEQVESAGFVPLSASTATLPPAATPAAGAAAANPTRSSQEAAGAGLAIPTLGAATPWWQTPTATRLWPAYVPPADTPVPAVVESAGGDSPPPEAPADSAPPADTAPPPPPPPADTAVPPAPTQAPPVPSDTSAPPPPSPVPPTGTAPPPTNTPEPPELLDVVICHIPPGNPSNRDTKTVGPDELASHLAHGDTLGPCS